MPQNEKARAIIESHYQNNDPIGWFEALYSTAAGSTEIIPWADQKPNPHLLAWVDETQTRGPGRAIVVGCGLGDDAEELAARGFDVDAFDVSPTAIAWCQKRFPKTRVRFTSADLLALPHDWRGRFDFVFEAYTIQALPRSLRAHAIKSVADLIAPNGKLLVVCRGREEGEPEGSLPWPLSHVELDQFKSHGLKLLSFENFFEVRGEERVRRFRVVYQKG